MRLLPLLLLSLALHAEDAKLPPDAQAAMDKADKSIATIQAKADGEINKVRQALITTLTDYQKATTKKGDLESAMAIKAKIEALDKLMPDLLGEKPKAHISTSKYVMIYPLPDYKGGATILKTEGVIMNWDKIQFPNDGLRSIKVPAGFKVTAFENENGGGTATVITEDNPKITGPALGMSSIIIERSE